MRRFPFLGRKLHPARGRGPTRRRILVVVVIALAIVALSGILHFRAWLSAIDDPRTQAFFRWKSGGEEARRALVTALTEPCPGAPFLLPSGGFIGLLYGDPRPPYSGSRLHQGIDIFSNSGPGQTPVHAALDGYLTREPDWRSSVIIRIPDDPLHPGRQIWQYYAHMANTDGTVSYIDEAFPPGTREEYVEQGMLLGYTGNYRGNSPVGVAVHLHFSIVLDDGQGRYRNELDFENTVDPSRYLGLAVNYACAPLVPNCAELPVCPDAVLGAGGS